MRRRVGRVHARDPKPLGLLISRIRDGEVLEPDPEERVVDEHLESRLIEKDSIAQADPAANVEETAADRRRDERDDEHGGGDGARQREPSEDAPGNARPTKPERRDDDRSGGDPNERAARLHDEHQREVEDRKNGGHSHQPRALPDEHENGRTGHGHHGDELSIEVRVAERGERARPRIGVDPLHRVAAERLLHRVQPRDRRGRADGPREPRRAARVIDRDRYGHGDEREDRVRREPEVTTHLSVDRDVLIFRGEGRHDFDRDHRVEREEQGRQRDAQAVAERDDDERPEQSPRERVGKARLRQIEDVEDRWIEREDEDRDLRADEEKRDLAPEDSAHDGPLASHSLLRGASRGARVGHYRALSKSSFARSKYQKPTTNRTIATPAEYASASHCGARPSRRARWYATMIEVIGLR